MSSASEIASAAKQSRPKTIIFSSASGAYFADLIAKQLNVPRAQIERRVRVVEFRSICNSSRFSEMARITTDWIFWNATHSLEPMSSLCARPPVIAISWSFSEWVMRWQSTPIFYLLHRHINWFQLRNTSTHLLRPVHGVFDNGTRCAPR